MHTKPKHPIQQITISHPNKAMGEKSFASFAEADEFLMRLASLLDEDAFLDVHMTWEGGLEYSDTLSLASDMKGPNYLENFLQISIVQQPLSPTEAKTLEEMHRSISMPSLQMERITIPDRDIDNLQAILTDCEGVNDEEVLATFELFERAMRRADRDHPLLLAIIKHGREVFQEIRDSSVTQYYQKKCMEKAKELYAGLLTELLSNDERAYSVFENRTLDFRKSIEMEDHYVDERFTSFGIKLYRLFPADTFFLNANALQLTPFNDAVSAEYRSRLETINDLFTDTSVADAYSSNYVEELRQIYLKPIAFRSHFHVSINTVQTLLDRGVGIEKVHEEMLKEDPFVPFFPESIYEDYVFREVDLPSKLSVSV